MKKVFLVLVAALALASGAFAQAALKNGMLIAPGSPNATVGFDFGLGVNAGFEYPLGRFDLGDLRFSYGAKAVGNVYFAGDWTWFGVGGVGTLHFAWGCLDLPKGLSWLKNVDSFAGLGLGFVGSSSSYGSSGDLGVFSHGGSSYFFSKSMALTVAGGIGGSYIGLLFKL